MIIDDENLRSMVNYLIKTGSFNLGENDKRFIKNVYCEGLTKYIRRLKAINFFDKEKVLDAGCGYGQWSLSLASLNRSVLSLDVSKNRLDFVKKLNEKLGYNSIKTKVSELGSMSLPSDTFDGIFCYGVIFLTSWHDSLKELYRVLKPGGQVYINANDVGWFIHLWLTQHNKVSDYDPRTIAANAFKATLNYKDSHTVKNGEQIIIEKNDLKQKMIDIGFIDILTNGEGKTHLNLNEPVPQPFFEETYYGLNGVFEVIAKKNH